MNIDNVSLELDTKSKKKEQCCIFLVLRIIRKVLKVFMKVHGKSQKESCHFCVRSFTQSEIKDALFYFK